MCAAANIYVASEGPCTHKELTGTLHLCTVSSVRLRTYPHLHYNYCHHCMHDIYLLHCTSCTERPGAWCSQCKTNILCLNLTLAFGLPSLSSSSHYSSRNHSLIYLQEPEHFVRKTWIGWDKTHLRLDVTFTRGKLSNWAAWLASGWI